MVALLNVRQLRRSRRVRRRIAWYTALPPEVADQRRAEAVRFVPVRSRKVAV